MKGDEGLVSGINLTRTFIPSLPPGYLNRKHLFPLLDNQAPGTTLVIAPAGYGKSSFVAQWAQEKRAIWMTVTEGDSLNEMSAMMIRATRNVIPNFGLWFDREQPMRPTDVVRRWGNELLESKENYVFVLDNLRTANSLDVDIETRLIEQFPSNVHFVAIRRNPLETIYSACASRGPLKVVTARDLSFSDDEIMKLANSVDIELDSKARNALFAAHGWPSATSLLLQHVVNQGDDLDIVRLMSSEIEPLRSLALLVINELDPKIVRIAEALSLLGEFDLTIAEYLLESEYSPNLISAIALKGEIFSPIRGSDQKFVFSPMIREIFLERMRLRTTDIARLFEKIIQYFEKRGNMTLAIEYAFQSGASEKIAQLFPTAGRMKQAQGLGDDLIRWSEYAALDPEEGYQKSLTVRIVGLLANLDFSSAKIENDRLEVAAEGSLSKEFYLQYVAGVRSYIALSVGNFVEVESLVNRAQGINHPCFLGIDDQINLLRLLANGYYLRNESQKVREVLEQAKNLLPQTQMDTSHTFILAIEAMDLHQQGEYRKASEVASIAISESKRHSFVGVHGPLDAMFVKALCLLEFSRIEEALATFEQIKELAFQWKQWNWFLAADYYLIQNLCINGLHKNAIERTRLVRDLVSSFNFSHNLHEMIDLIEICICSEMKDYDRLKKLVSRSPNFRRAYHLVFPLDQEISEKPTLLEINNLPDNSPREYIWKHLNMVLLNIDSEHLAIQSMKKAMKVGASVGAKETFLRQNESFGTLILKISSDNPTVYNEELATATATRMRNRRKKMNEEHPTLTRREQEILRQLSTGRTLTVIAEELHISQNTIKTHLKNLYRKMGVEGRKEAVEKASSLFLL